MTCRCLRTLTAMAACVALAVSTTGVRADGASEPTPYALDENGARVLGELPPVGEHPRLYFNADGLPRIKQRLETTAFGKAFKKTVLGTVQQVQERYAGLAALGAEDITREVVETHMRPDEGRNIQWGVASVYAAAYDDADFKQFMARVITNHGRILLASKQLGVGGTARLWDTTNFSVGESWTIGAAGLAVSYDVLFNNMTAEQRSIVREAIATATKGRRSYGADLPKGFASSNHYGYHGDLLVLLCAIEGEEGFNRATYDTIRRIMRDYWEVALTDLGVCREDAYVQLGLRAGSRALAAMARRGDNVFGSEKYRHFMEHMVLDVEPFPGGAYVGGASGSMATRLYQTYAVVGRYMRPEDAAANVVYRHTFGDDYGRGFRWQGHLDLVVFGGDWKGPDSREEALRESGLPLSRFYPVRGKLTFRSDWSDEALQVHFDARPDAFLIGHDKVDRGHFTLSALGRNWAYNGGFATFGPSTHNSLVHIDGKAQGWKAPSVRFQTHRITPIATTGSADLKYAYDWQWSPPWPAKEDGRYPASKGWEPERSDPRDLGWPTDHTPDWLPDQIYGSRTGYATKRPAGNWMRRWPYNPVLRARRATAAVRGRHPYAIVADDIQKDEKAHTYRWTMQLPTDLELKVHRAGDFIVGEADEPATGGRCLLVRALQADTTGNSLAGRVEAYVAHTDTRRGKKTEGKRLILEVTAVAPHFKIMLFPHLVGEALPTTRWIERGRILTVRWADQRNRLTFASGEDACTIAVTQE